MPSIPHWHRQKQAESLTVHRGQQGPKEIPETQAPKAFKARLARGVRREKQEQPAPLAPLERMVPPVRMAHPQRIVGTVLS